VGFGNPPQADSRTGYCRYHPLCLVRRACGAEAIREEDAAAEPLLWDWAGRVGLPLR